MTTISLIAPSQWTPLRSRPQWLRRLGEQLHPEAITGAWYAADCPPRLDRGALPLRTRARWALARMLRGVTA